MRSMATDGMTLTSTSSCACAPMAWGDQVVRRPLMSTSERLGPRPRMLTVARSAPAPAWNWSVSPSAPWLNDRFLMRSSTVGAPSFARSSRVSVVTGSGASSGVPLM